MNSEPRSSNSTNTTAVTLHDALQTGPNSYISSSTDPGTRCTHDSDTMSVEQELRCILAEENTTANESPEHRKKIQPSQQCLTDSMTSTASSTTNMTDHEGMPEDNYSQIYKPCDCLQSQTHLGKMHNIVTSSQSCSWDEVEQDTYMSVLQDTSYNLDDAPCSFKVIVVPPKKRDRNTYICKECGQHFTKESNLKKHVERLSQQLAEPHFKCKYCNHIFKSKEARKRHHPVHKVCPTIGFTKVRCSVCGFMFSSREKLQHHLHRFTENPDERIFKCFFCSHAFTTDFSRNRHEGQMHTEAHRLPCCCCGKLFNNRYKLKLHRIKQQIQRPPRCQDCGWVFAAQEYLEDHMRQVQRDLPLECLICHHRYRSQLALLRHLKFHTRKMEYECPSCLGRFSSQNLLTKHLRTAPQRANIEPY